MQGKGAEKCFVMCQAELFLPDVFLCFILQSAALSACHWQIHSLRVRVYLCVFLRERDKECLRV